jgi:hypothetical protein
MRTGWRAGLEYAMHMLAIPHHYQLCKYDNEPRSAARDSVHSPCGPYNFIFVQ